ncbi:MAG TPA: hypothetical protein VF757_10240 [Sphingomicrobium sp.]
MAHHQLMAALAVMAAALPSPANPGASGAPAGSPSTRYCLRVEPDPYSRIETIQCRTREEWAELGLDVDHEWAENGVRVIG